MAAASCLKCSLGAIKPVFFAYHILMTCLITFYNAKKSPWAMGLCRAFNVLLGGAAAVRIRVSGGGVSDDTYLQMACFDPSTGGLTIGNTPGTTVVEVPTYDVYAYLGPDGYNYDNAAYSFAIELGNWSDGTWTVLAESDLATYSELAGHIAPGGGGLDVPYALPWNPQNYHYVVPVPEPGSALLIVIGCAVLALRRRPAV